MRVAKFQPNVAQERVSPLSQSAFRQKTPAEMLLLLPFYLCLSLHFARIPSQSPQPPPAPLPVKLNGKQDARGAVQVNIVHKSAGSTGEHERKTWTHSKYEALTCHLGSEF
jgi:hypothetical protein